MTEPGLKSNSFETKPKTKRGSGRAIFRVKGIILKCTLSTYFAQERMWKTYSM